MKNLFATAFLFLGVFAAFRVEAQPQGFSYQALVRDPSGAPVRNHAVSVRIRLHQDSAAGAQVYSETHSPNTNAFGNINLVIGKGGSVSGTFSSLDWSHAMFIEIGIDPNGGSSFTNLGGTQLWSVPYALYAGKSTQTQSQIADADNDTKIQTEKNANENMIRFSLGGSEKMRLSGSRLEFLNTGGSVFLGAGAGTNDDLNNRNNVFVGQDAGLSNTTGDANTFSGHEAGNSNSTGSGNTFTGASAGFLNGTGSENMFSGHRAGYKNTNGAQNMFAGSFAGYSNSTGLQNAFSGYQAGFSNTDGANNAYFGTNAGFTNSRGDFNTFLGYNAGYANDTGSGNVFIGVGSGYNELGSNKLYIENSASTSPLIWGDFDADSVRVNGGLSVARAVTAAAFNSSSDRRLKENIAPLPNALEGVGQLNGVYYNFKDKAPDGNAHPKGRQIGVIAQDVEKVYPELVAAQPGGYKAVDYPKLTAVLIEAVKELRTQNQGLQARLDKVEESLRLSAKTSGTRNLAASVE